MRKYWLYLIIIVQLVVVTSLLRSVTTTWSSGKRLDDLMVRKQQLADKKNELEGKIAQLNSEYYVEKVARDQLHLVKEGEVVVMLPENAETTKQVEDADVEKMPNYRKWLVVFHLEKHD